MFFLFCSNFLYMSLVTRKPVFGVSDQVRFKPVCTAIETSWRLEILNVETTGIILSKQRITKAHRYAGWSAPFLFAYGKSRFSYDVAHMGRVKRIWYLSPMRAAKVQASLRIRAVSPEPPLSLIQAVSQEEPSDRKPDPWPIWMAGHAQLKFVMTECSKTQIRLMRLIW